MTANIVTTDGKLYTTVAATNILSNNEDGIMHSSASSIVFEIETSIFFDVLTETTEVLLVTTNAHVTTRILDSTAVLPATTNTLSTDQMGSSVVSTSRESSSSVVVDEPTNIPSEESFGNSSSVGAIIGVTVGAIILIATMTGVLVFISVRKKRSGGKYQISWKQQSGDLQLPF